VNVNWVELTFPIAINWEKISPDCDCSCIFNLDFKIPSFKVNLVVSDSWDIFSLSSWQDSKKVSRWLVRFGILSVNQQQGEFIVIGLEFVSFLCPGSFEFLISEHIPLLENSQFEFCCILLVRIPYEIVHTNLIETIANTINKLCTHIWLNLFLCASCQATIFELIVLDDILSFLRIKQFHRITKKEKAIRLDCPILCLLHLTGSVGLVSTIAQFLPSRWNQLIIFTDSRTILEIVLFWLNANRVSLFFSDSVTLRTILSVLVWLGILLYLDIIQI